MLGKETIAFIFAKFLDAHFMVRFADDFPS
jgi:hypothetical protein